MTELLEELDYMNSRLKVWQEACIKLIRTISYIRMNAYRLNVNSSCLACTPVLQASIHRKDNVYLGRAQITHLRWFNITSRCQYIIKLLAGHFSEKKKSKYCEIKTEQEDRVARPMGSHDSKVI